MSVKDDYIRLKAAQDTLDQNKYELTQRAREITALRRRLELYEEALRRIISNSDDAMRTACRALNAEEL